MFLNAARCVAETYPTELMFHQHLLMKATRKRNPLSPVASQGIHKEAAKSPAMPGPREETLLSKEKKNNPNTLV